MTKTELAVKELEDLKKHYIPECNHAVINIAEKSLLAWDKVVEDLRELTDEYNNQFPKGNSYLKWCAIKEAIAIVENHVSLVQRKEKDY